MTIDVLKTLPNDSNHNLVVTNTRSSPPLPVRRSLFGDVNHDECMDFLKKELDSVTNEEMKRWNFDFVNERPMEDSCSALYKWTRVQPDEEIPKAYALSRLPYLSKSAEVSITQLDDSSCSPEQNVVCRSVEIESRLQNRVTVAEPRLTQKSIDGYMKSKKRLSSTKLSKSEKNDLVRSSMSINLDSNECKQYHHPLVPEEPSNKKLRLSPY